MHFTSLTPVEPMAGTWRMVCAPDPHTLHVPPPPANDAAATRAELAELRLLSQNRTAEDVRQVLRWSVNERSLLSNWDTLVDELIRRYNLSPPAAARVHWLLSSAVHGALIGTWSEKYRYLRPRPSVLDPGVNVSLIPVPEHPAYPSGHSTVAGAAATVIARLFPAEAPLAAALAQDSGLSRLKAGLHYRSDHTAGLAMGRQMAEAVLQSVLGRDQAPLVYLPPPGSPRLTFQELLARIDQNCR